MKCYVLGLLLSRNLVCVYVCGLNSVGIVIVLLLSLLSNVLIMLKLYLLCMML